MDQHEKLDSQPVEKENKNLPASERNPHPLAGFKRPAFSAPAFKIPQSNFKKPALSHVINNTRNTNHAPQDTTPSISDSYYFTVIYTKYQPHKKHRKNKSFSDGVLHIKMPGFKTCLYDSDEGKLVTSTQLKGYSDPTTLANGSGLIMGSWEIEIDAPMSETAFQSGQAFLKKSSSSSSTSSIPSSAMPLGTVGISTAFKRPLLGPSNNNNNYYNNKNNTTNDDNSTNSISNSQPTHTKPALPPIYDPHAPNAVILNADQWKNGAGRDKQGRLIHPVVLDPFLAKSMRPHQVQGVQFLYTCVMPTTENGNYGAILADSMGLGKTLTTIALIWTLLKQNPMSRSPTITKALIITPSSLTQNWAQEINKWLGSQRLTSLIIPPGSAGAQLALDFKAGAVYRVAIMSYEAVRHHAAALADRIHLLVADEGHRLKSVAGNKTIDALCALRCRRRILLTGTPVQNNLTEFFAMCDFVNPSILGTAPVFNRVFAKPIASSRDRNASEEDKALGEARSEELFKRVASFVLRRGPEVNEAYLPPISVFVVFCRPSEVQIDLIKDVLGKSQSVRQIVGGGMDAHGRAHVVTSGADFGDQALGVLIHLRKICNHPLLLADTTQIHEKIHGDDDNNTIEKTQNRGSENTLKHEIENFGNNNPPNSSYIYTPSAPSHNINNTDNNNTDDNAQESSITASSGKMNTLSILLHHIIKIQQCRCVVVSQSTAMLDIIARHCTAHKYSTVRIDGAVDPSKRQDIVDAFNMFHVGDVFLLSTTAGGVGLNLIGAHHLILFDSHWNPALDTQAMARIWRDGQKKECVVYRLLTTGTLEEKIYQRQRAKQDIASVTMDTAPSLPNNDTTTVVTTANTTNNTSTTWVSASVSAGFGVLNNANSILLPSPKKNKKKGGQFTKEELRLLFTLRTDTLCDTSDVLNSDVFVDVSQSCSDGPLQAAIRDGSVTFVYKEHTKSSSSTCTPAIIMTNNGDDMNDGKNEDGARNSNGKDGIKKEMNDDDDDEYASDLDIDFEQEYE